jgi:hypothetical protein
MNRMVGKDAGSPESVPSVAEISQASSNDTDYVSRVLFQNQESESIVVEEVVENMQKLEEREEQGDHGQVYGSDISITSSEMTVVASWNLSPTTEDKNKSSQEEAAAAAAADEPPIMLVEDPEEDAPSCNGALNLTPRQLAEMFLVFEGARKIWPTRKTEENVKEDVQETIEPALTTNKPPDGPSAPTSPREDNWRPRAETLEKECAALKNIIRVDSSNLLKLRRAMEAQRELDFQKDVKIDEMERDVQMTMERLEAMKREGDVQRERESELMETIRILKDEVDKLTQSREVHNIASSRPEAEHSEYLDLSDIQNQRQKNQLFASQIVENELALGEQRSALETKTAENWGLRREIECLQQRLESRDENADKKDAENMELKRQLGSLQLESNADRNDGEQASTEEELNLGDVLAGISARVEAAEKEREQVEQKFREELKKRENDIDEIRNLLELARDSRKNHLKISQNPEEIEVFLSRGEKEQGGKMSRKGKKQNRCWNGDSCDAWNAISGNLG